MMFRPVQSLVYVAPKSRYVEPNIDELKALIARASNAHPSVNAERRALEFAISAIEVLRDTGTISSADLFRIAEFLGYDSAAIASAWATRGDFDIEKTHYALDAPIAKVTRVQ